MADNRYLAGESPARWVKGEILAGVSQQVCIDADDVQRAVRSSLGSVKEFHAGYKGFSYTGETIPYEELRNFSSSAFGLTPERFQAAVSELFQRCPVANCDPHCKQVTGFGEFCRCACHG
jgi:hypothetical protein